MVDIQGTEYSNLLDATGGAGAAEYSASYLQTVQAGTSDIGAAGLASTAGLGGAYTSESYESYSTEGGVGGGLLTGGIGPVELGPAAVAGAGGYSTFESVSATGADMAGVPSLDAAGIAGMGAIGGLGLAGGVGVGGGTFESSYYSSTVGDAGGIGAGLGAGVAGGLGGALVAAGGIEAIGGAGAAGDFGHALPLSAYRIQEDLNPTIVRRTFAGAPLSYRQNIMIRFLKPPTPPAPGPLIIKEIRPPQPRPAPPLIIRQRPPRPRTPPPLVLRERPPRMPAVVKTETIIKKLAPFPAPPRQVIIERYPALPPKPRDVIIERWLQYGPMPKRRVIYQKAAVGRIYRTPKNVVIQYVAPRPHIQRIFRRLGVVSMNPSSYISAHGATLLDSGSLVSTARNAGVIENISPPALVFPAGGVAAGAGIRTAAGAGGLAAFESTSTEITGMGGAVEAYGAGYESVYGGMGGVAAAELAGATGLGAGMYSVGGGGAGFGVSTTEHIETTTGGAPFEYSAGGVEIGGGLGAGFTTGITETSTEIGGEIAGMNVEQGGASYETSASYVAETTT